MEIIEVQTKNELREFLDLPERIYPGKYPRYVKPIDAFSKMLIGKVTSSKKHLLIARKNGKAVARVGVKVHSHGGETSLNWGFFECMEGHADATAALFDKAHNMYPNLTMRGPYQFRMEDPFIGTLVQGFESDPYFLMSYNPPYYGEYLEACGHYGVMDLNTYEVVSNAQLPKRMFERSKAAAEAGYTIRYLNPKRMRKDVKIISGIFNEALAGNWGFEEMPDSQINEMYMQFKLFINSEMVALAQKDGEDVACLILLPNFNPIIKEANGKITPKLIWDVLTKKNKLEWVRGYALGVKKAHHGSGVGSLLTTTMFDKGLNQLSVKGGEISWILGDNGSMNHLAEDMQGKVNKIYRIYDRK